jgi:sugar/nucleoside kinase (ribokinase family)
MKKGITFAGVIVVDQNKYIRNYPKEGELTNIYMESTTYGGLVSNTGVNFAALKSGIPIYAAGNVGDDEMGNNIINYFNNQGICTQQIIKHKGYKTATVDAYINTENNERTFFANLAVNDIFGKEFPNIKTEYLHIGYLLLMPYLDEIEDGKPRLVKHLKHLSDKGVKISIDLVTENTNRYNEVVVPALKYVDNIIINELEASYLSKVKIVDELNEVNIDKLKEAAKVIKEYGVKDLVIIHSPLVSLLYDGFKFTVLTSLKLPEGFIKSSVGAGDGFCAGALFGIIKGLPPKEILEIASSLAAAVLNSETSHSEIKGLKNILRLEKLYGRYK